MNCWMMKKIITKNAEETKKLGMGIADKFQGGEIICLEGDLGAGKTTFSQGLLQGLGAEGPYTSPTFVVMKEYKTKSRNIYHIDAYRINKEDVLELGWEELVADKSNVIILEWPEKIKKIIPENSLWIKFRHLDKNKREIIYRPFVNKISKKI